jgi:lipopolysaccharide transport system permease protein
MQNLKIDQPGGDPHLTDVELPTRVISSERAMSHSDYLREVLKFWNVFLVMAGRDTLVRYRYALFGVTWAVLRPLLVLVTFSAIFRGLVASHNTSVSYAWIVLCAAPIWIFFSSTVQDSISFVLRDTGLINRVCFPRILLVLAGVSVGVVDFLISLSLVVVALFFASTLHFPNVLLLPVAVLWSVVLVSGCSLWVATLNARYRDVSNLVPFCMHLLLVLSPIGYSAQSLPREYMRVLALNPLVGLLEVFRFCLIGQSMSGEVWTIVTGLVVTALIAITGYLFFRSLEPWMNDYA